MTAEPTDVPALARELGEERARLAALVPSHPATTHWALPVLAELRRRAVALEPMAPRVRPAADGSGAGAGSGARRRCVL